VSAAVDESRSSCGENEGSSSEIAGEAGLARGIVCQKSVVRSQRDEELSDQRYRNSNQSAREIALRKSAGLPQASVFLISPRATDLRRGRIKRDQERRVSSLSLRKNKTAPARADETRKRRNASVCDRYFARVTAAC